MPWQVFDAEPHDVLDLLHDERLELLGLLRSLRADDWARPTECPGWGVREIAAHLLHDDLRLLAHLRDGYQRAWFNGPVADLGPWLHERNQHFVSGTEDLSPDVIVDLLDWTASRLDAIYAARDPLAHDDAVAWAVPDASCPNWLGSGREYTERLAHQNQIRRAIGTPELDGERWLGPALDIWRWCLPVALRGVPGSVRISTFAPERTWHLSDGDFVDALVAPDASVSLPAAALVAAWTAAPEASISEYAIGGATLIAALGRARAIIV